MTQEDKDLLIKDLCARLPYGVNVFYHTDDFETKHDELSPQKIDMLLHRSDVVIKPYLRPMSSMTEEERKELWELLKTLGITAEIKRLDWLVAHHFDIRNLIEKGLAIEASEGMYKLDK